eukprot:365417-Chlamydomonas_euryale.AAC.9
MPRRRHKAQACKVWHGCDHLWAAQRQRHAKAWACKVWRECDLLRVMQRQGNARTLRRGMRPPHLQKHKMWEPSLRDDCTNARHALCQRDALFKPHIVREHQDLWLPRRRRHATQRRSLRAAARVQLPGCRHPYGRHAAAATLVAASDCMQPRLLSPGAFLRGLTQQAPHLQRSGVRLGRCAACRCLPGPVQTAARRAATAGACGAVSAPVISDSSAALGGARLHECMGWQLSLACRALPRRLVQRHGVVAAVVVVRRKDHHVARWRAAPALVPRTASRKRIIARSAGLARAEPHARQLWARRHRSGRITVVACQVDCVALTHLSLNVRLS